jgi:hypothetical protein
MNGAFQAQAHRSAIFGKSNKSLFDVPDIKTKATTKDILEANRESRERVAKQVVED